MAIRYKCLCEKVSLFSERNFRRIETYLFFDCAAWKDSCWQRNTSAFTPRSYGKILTCWNVELTSCSKLSLEIDEWDNLYYFYYLQNLCTCNVVRGKWLVEQSLLQNVTELFSVSVALSGQKHTIRNSNCVLSTLAYIWRRKPQPRNKYSRNTDCPTCFELTIV